MRQGGDRTLAHLDLAREARHPPVLADAQERIEIARHGGTGGPGAFAEHFLRDRQVAQGHEDHDPPGNALEEFAAGRRKGARGVGYVVEVQLLIIVGVHVTGLLS